MKYKDYIYGEFEITEPVILEIINSPILQRLREVNQAGYEPLLMTMDTRMSLEHYNRFAHSVGVFLLLKKYKAPIEEQVAGLIHDVSHSCFSHSIDYALKSGSEKKQDLQDNIFDNFVRNSEIKDIIEKHGLDINYILDEENFPLKEKELPDLCADRIDYSLRDTFIFKEINEKEKEYFLNNLITENQSWIFKNFESAKKFALLFLRQNRKYWSGIKSAIMFRVTGDFLKHSLKKKYITKDDLYKTDGFVIKKIKKHLKKDKELELLWKRMKGETKIINNPDDYDAIVFCKSRAVDPPFKEKGEIKRFSDKNRKWKKIIKKELLPKQYFLKFLD